jgi:uncharacterized protein involved in oxidation of intracellular sulfur
MHLLFILNDPPYGTERSYNALRLANALVARDQTQVRVFLMGDAASCAKAGQKVPSGYYNLERMLAGIVRRGGEIAVCGSCMDARGLTEGDLVEGVRRGSLAELACWTTEADRVLTF